MTDDRSSVPYRERERSVTMEPMGADDELHEELFTLNIGPHHPATHGVLRLLTTLEGEVVRDIKPIIGYVHTGIEKCCEDQQYWKVITFVERMDYLAYYFNATAYCMAVETLLEEEVPPRAQYLRVAHMELNRIASHLFALATGALDLGAITMLWWGCRDRDLVLDLFEMSSGQRMHPRYIQVGGVIEDIPPGWEKKVREFLADHAHAPRPVRGPARPQRDLAGAPQGHRRVSQERALELGVTGPLLRATGHPWDLRKAMPYSCYEHFDFEVPVGTSATTTTASRCAWTRCASRSRSSSRRSTACPRAPSSPTNRKVALPPRHELATSMEALIHHFKLVTEGFRVPPGEAYAAIESPRGELGCFVLADGSSKPARVHMRDPSFVNLQSLPDMARDSLIADFIACVAMLDPILGGVDR